MVHPSDLLSLHLVSPKTTGLSVGYSSLSKLLTIYGYDSLTSSHEGHTHGLALLEHGSSMPMAAFYVAAGTIIAKEALYRATISVAKSEDSSLLKAQAWHHRSDALSTRAFLSPLSLFYGVEQVQSWRSSQSVDRRWVSLLVIH